MDEDQLSWGESEVQVSGLNEAVDARLLPPGQLVEVVNGEFTTKGASVRKRPGTKIVVDYSSVTRLIHHEQKNHVLAYSPGDGSTPPQLYAEAFSVAEHVLKAPASAVLVERNPLSTDLQSDVMTDVAWVGPVTGTQHGWLVYGVVHLQTGNIAVKVVEVGVDGRPGATVYEKDLVYSRGDGTAFWVRAAACRAYSEEKVLVSWSHDSGKVYGVVVDATVAGSLPTVGARTLILSDMPATTASWHDTCGLSANADLTRWALVHNHPTGGFPANEVKLRQLSSALATTSSATFGNAPRAFTVLEKGQEVWINWYDFGDAEAVPDPIDPAWRFAVYSADTGAQILAPSVWCDSSDVGSHIDGNGQVSGISFPASAGEAVLFHSQHWEGTAGTEPLAFKDRFLTRWRRVSDAAAMLTGLQEKRGPRLISKPWQGVADATHYAWCELRYVRELPPNGPSGWTPVYDRTAVLLRFTEQGSYADSPVYNRSNLEGTTAALSLGDPILYDNTRVYEIPQSLTEASTRVEDSVLQSKRTSLNIRYVPEEEKSGPWDVSVTVPAHSLGLYNSVHFGGSTYSSGGVVSQWDGDRHHENGFVHGPNIQATMVNTGGTWGAEWAEQHVYYQAVYEVVAENGERIKSATSAVLDVTLTGDVGLGQAPQDVITLYLEPHTVTQRNFGAGQTNGYLNPVTIVTVYRSTEPNGTELHRVFEFESTFWDALITDPDDLAPITVDDDGTSLGGVLYDLDEMAEQEVVYTDSGELDNDMVYGGATALTVHKERLWASGGDDPEVIWYSKERVDGRPAEFSLGQQVRIPGVRVVGIASLGDMLAAFAENSTYAVFGDGPNATGDPSSGSFGFPFLLSGTTGCVDGGSIVTLPVGVMFRSGRGFYLLDQSRQFKFVGDPVRDIVKGVTRVLSGKAVPGLTQVRYHCLGSNESAFTLVYDWEAERWTRWEYQLSEPSVLEPPPLSYMVDTVVLPDFSQGSRRDRVLMLDNFGAVYEETPGAFADAFRSPTGYPYQMRVRTGWLSFGRVQGHKRIRKCGILLQDHAGQDPFAWGAKLTVDYNYDYSGSGLRSTHSWDSWTIGAIMPRDGTQWLRATMKYQKQPAVQVELQEALPSPRMTGTVGTATVDTTLGNNVLKVRGSAFVGFTAIVLTSHAALPMTAVASQVTAALKEAGLQAVLRARLASGFLVIENVEALWNPSAPYVEVDSVAGGSTANSVLGFNVLGATGVTGVLPEDNAGYSLQSFAFEIGMVRGIRRLPAAQSR